MLVNQIRKPISVCPEINNWISQIRCPETKKTIEMAINECQLTTSKEIPVEVEDKLIKVTRLDEDAKRLITRLLKSCNGIDIRTIGMTTDDLECASENCNNSGAKLVDLALARIDSNPERNEFLLKPLRSAFTYEVQRLVGY